jgi:hypothetical protein
MLTFPRWKGEPHQERRMHRVVMCYAASRRRAQGSVHRARRATADQGRRATAGSHTGTDITRENERKAAGAPISPAMLERCVEGTAEPVVVPRGSASNDGEIAAGANRRAAAHTGVAEATNNRWWNSCRFIATRFR